MGKTMKQAFRFIVGLLLVVGWLLATLSLHLVRTSDDLPTLVTKDHLGFTDTYVDTRQWTPDDVANHPALVQRLVDLHKGDLLKHVFKDGKQDLTVQLMTALEKAPKQKQNPSTTSTQPTQAAAAMLFSLF